ncbi:unnamed protein product [Effrenium voratum]|nr:unnamed protein product [Effrenium voratum]
MRPSWGADVFSVGFRSPSPVGQDATTEADEAAKVAAEIFQNAKNLAQALLGLASPGDATASQPKEIQEYLKSVGHGDFPWQYLEASGARGLGLGSNRRRCSRAAFLALALYKASAECPDYLVPEILKGPLSVLSTAIDLEAPKRTAWEKQLGPQNGPVADFQQMFEAAWNACVEWLEGHKLDDMPGILELHHVEALKRAGCEIGRKKAHNILMAARGLMMTELQTSSEDVLQKSLAGRPWQAIVAGSADKIRTELVGPGIKDFHLEMRRRERCPYTRDPMAVFVAVHSDGQKVIHHPHAHKDEPLRFEDEEGTTFQRPPDKDEIVRAFRLATAWSVKKRWTAFQTGVFQDILKRFKETERSEGFSISDFKPGTRVQAWELSPELKLDFLKFLQCGCARSSHSELVNEDEVTPMAACSSSDQDAVGSHPGAWESWDKDSFWRNGNSWWNDSSWHGWQSSSWHSSSGSLQWTGSWTGSWKQSDESWQASDEWEEDEDLNSLHKEALSNLGFTSTSAEENIENMQSVMINEFLRTEFEGSSRLLAGLDPARDETAVRTYASLIREIEVSQLRYSHGNISRKFLHGEHRGMDIESLTQQLYHGELQTTEVKPLVGVNWKGAVWVICGNRRCHAMKLYVEWLGPRRPMPKARVILHDFPRLSGIQDEQVRWAFMLKAVSSMNTRSEGRHVQVRRRFR